MLEKWQLSHGFAVDGAYSLGFGTVVSEKWRLSQGSAVEKPYSWDFGTFQSEHWPLSHGFAVGGACSLGFGTVKATILVTVVILAACFAVCAWSRYISRTPCTGFGVDQLIVDQLIADAPCPWRERSQGFASLLCQSYDRNVENWLLNESGWDCPSTM